MYLFFLLHQKGYPVNEIYEEKLKWVPTAQFIEYINGLNEEDIENDDANTLPVDENGDPIRPSSIAFDS